MEIEEDEYAPIFSFLGWELWPWTDHLRWMLTHDRLMICEWRRRGGLFVYRRNLMARLGFANPLDAAAASGALTHRVSGMVKRGRKG